MGADAPLAPPLTVPLYNRFFFSTYTLGSLNTCKCQMCFLDVFFKIIDFSYRMRLTAKSFLKNPYFECTDAIDVIKIKWALLGQVYLNFVTYTKAVPLIKKNLRWFLDYSSIFEQSSFFYFLVPCNDDASPTNHYTMNQNSFQKKQFSFLTLVGPIVCPSPT